MVSTFFACGDFIKIMMGEFCNSFLIAPSNCIDCNKREFYIFKYFLILRHSTLKLTLQNGIILAYVGKAKFRIFKDGAL